MATALATRKPRIRPISPNGPMAKDLAGDFPRYMVGPGDEITELSYFERAMLRFTRALPADLCADFDACLQLRGDAYFEALKAFQAKLAPRRNELVGW